MLIKQCNEVYWQDIFPMCHGLVPYLIYDLVLNISVWKWYQTIQKGFMDFPFYITCYIYDDNVKMETCHIPAVDVHTTTLSSTNLDGTQCPHRADKCKFLQVSHYKLAKEIIYGCLKLEEGIQYLSVIFRGGQSGIWGLHGIFWHTNSLEIKFSSFLW